jgi:hypothetical protein
MPTALCFGEFFVAQRSIGMEFGESFKLLGDAHAARIEEP